MNTYVRAKIRLTTDKDVLKFLSIITKQDDTYYVEDFSAMQRVAASSLLGLMYAALEYGAEMYVVNDTNDGVFPKEIDDLRV